jgi:hypothetical protein
MKKILLAVPAFFIFSSAHCQWWETYQYFDGADTIPGQSVFVELDTCDVWQIGPPQKAIFDVASSIPNVLVTDTINPYPDSVTCSASFFVPEDVFNTGAIIAVQWMQQLDLDTSNDVGIVEVSVDSGDTWINAFDFPEVYNFYGYLAGNVETITPYGDCFTGTDSVWRNIWLCFDYSVTWLYTSLEIRYTIATDTITTNHEGWMIDNLLVMPTWFHPVSEQSKPDNFKIYPTVANQFIWLDQLNTAPEFKIYTMSILDARGTVVKSISVTSTHHEIEVSDLASGRYYLIIESNEKKETYPIVISR